MTDYSLLCRPHFLTLILRRTFHTASNEFYKVTKYAAGLKTAGPLRVHQKHRLMLSVCCDKDATLIREVFFLMCNMRNALPLHCNLQPFLFISHQALYHSLSPRQVKISSRAFIGAKGSFRFWFDVEMILAVTVEHMLQVVELEGEKGALVVTSLTPTTSWRNATVTAAGKQGAHLFIRWTNTILFLHSKPSQLTLPSVPRAVTGSLHQRVACLCLHFYIKGEVSLLAPYLLRCFNVPFVLESRKSNYLTCTECPTCPSSMFFVWWNPPGERELFCVQ